uniref:protein-tyrosine-phosphatase n=1 Tax=Culicoides sonorensis TaxID=179676 RepID=A0A336LNK0_CULSO
MNFFLADEESIPIKHKITVAQSSVSLECNGISDNSLVDSVLWKKSNNIAVAKYSGGKTITMNERVTLSLDNFTLFFNPVLPSDTAEYICLINDRQNVPDPPERPLVTSFTSRSVNLSWAHSQFFRNAPVENFEIETRIGEEGPWNEKDSFKTNSSRSTFHIKGLQPFTVYSFRVKAINSIGKSSPSKPSYYIVTLREVPEKPRKLSVLDVTSTTIKISWIEPLKLNGAIHGYRVYSVNPLIQKTDVSGPSPPVIVNLTCSSTDSVYLRWRRPLIFYNTIDLYVITFRDVNTNDFKSIKIDNSSATHTEIAMVLSNLTANTLYEMKVRAASLSTINPKKLILGGYSEPKRIKLHPNCEKIQSLLRHAQDDYNVIYMIGIGFSLFGMIIIIVAVLLWRHCFYSPYYYIDVPSYKTQRMSTNWNDPVEIGGDIKNPISVTEFTKHTASLHVDSDIGFSKEYEAIQNECIVDEHSSEFSLHPENKTKNRYLNITASNYIDGYNQSRAFIATQGPLPETFACFWRMIWEQQVSIIVMITNLIERGRRKCDMYWPRDGTQVYGVISVTFLEENVLATYTVRTFSLKHLKLKKKKGIVSDKKVFQYHYTNWPDHGTSDPLPVLNFIKKSSSANSSNTGPIVVHCSAGVGRTGTYIVLDAMLKQIEDQNLINIFGFLRHIRKQRNFLVQTEDQYIFIHDALSEAITCGETTLKRNDILKMTTEHEIIEHQFSLITSFKPKDINMMSAAKTVNLSKNRGNLVPLECSRVHLTPKPGQEGSDYINASWLHGFRRLKDFIVTQHPLTHTKKDFWQMVWDHNIQTIVLLTFLDEEFTPFWPCIGDKLNGESFSLKLISENTYINNITRIFSITSRKYCINMIRLFHFL